MIFISYSIKNGELAAKVKGELEDGHYSCFLAHDDVAVSTDWHEEIWKALRACDAFVGLVTEEFNASAFCQQEVGAALALNKPRLLVRLGVPDPPGFASRFQGAKRDGLLHALDTLDMFQALRIESWIAAVASVQNYNESNSVHERFRAAWDDMSDEKKLRWLLAAAGNSQVRNEGFKAGPFYRSALKKLKPSLTDQWLFDNDKTGVLHDPDDNPVSKPKKAKAKK
ncbi:MAG: toll/interleukin-1 receptor domain-containing protein [Planctomycetes bacterium]|nr:toll/interleukin-1 receptor domain-containing protein [Planctomycetota bacterium]